MKMPLMPSGLSTSGGLAQGLEWEVLGALSIQKRCTHSIPGGQGDSE